MSTALILSGGGARAAYQVGVLRAVMEIQGRDELPFDVICGTSAGAINAVFLAANAHCPREGIERLYRAWRGIRPADVYDHGWGAVAGNLWRIARASLPRAGERAAPSALLDNAPLRLLLCNWLDFDAARRNLADGLLRTLCITAMDYGSGTSVAFFEGGDAEPWNRLYRRGERTAVTLEHVMASAAIPVLFPAQPIDRRYFGDGALRQLHPISPALKFGASRLFVIGVSAPFAPPPTMTERRRPGIGQMAAHLMNREFIDNLGADIEQARHFNEVGRALAPADRERLGMQPIETLVITPSAHFNEIAAEHIDRQPATVRLLFRMLGTTARGAGASFASYLMFDGAFCLRLMDMGYRDAMHARERVREFLGAPAAPAAAACPPG
jgi:NTE family protein